MSKDEDVVNTIASMAVSLAFCGRPPNKVAEGLTIGECIVLNLSAHLARTNADQMRIGATHAASLILRTIRRASQLLDERLAEIPQFSTINFPKEMADALAEDQKKLDAMTGIKD